MPLFDYVCPTCGATVEVLVRRCTDVVLCRGACNRMSTRIDDALQPIRPQEMTRQPAAPAFHVRGFSAQSGYANARTMTTRHLNGRTAGITTHVTGNAEGFADGLHK